MTTLTLLVKASHPVQIRQIDELLKNQFAELDVEVQVTSNSNKGWVQVSLIGEDEGIASSYINKEFGVCPKTLENAKNYLFLKGYVSKVDAIKQELRIDVGVFEPKVIQAVISLTCLQTQLADGKQVSLQKLAEMYGLVEGLPIATRAIGENANESNWLHSELSSEQVAKLRGWQMSLLDRLIILRASRETVDAVLERTRLVRDVIDVEPLGIFEHALTCKLGTDAAGLMPKLGRYMRYSKFVVFNAEKAFDFLNS